MSAALETPVARPAATWRRLARALLRTATANAAMILGTGLFLAVVVVAVCAPLLVQHDPLDQDLLARLVPPSPGHLLGTDAFGRDIWARIVYGARISLVIGLVAVSSAMVIGSSLGILSGYMGGWVDQVISQAANILLAFPSLILGLMIVAFLGPSVPNLIAAIALATTPQFIRIARAPTIALRERDFIQACRALGFSPFRIMLRHVLPNIWPEILVMGSLWLATAIRVEASLAFIGLGVKPPTPTWGGMIREGFEQILTSAYLAVFPSLAILVVVLALNMIGDGLRDVLDPRLKESSR